MWNSYFVLWAVRNRYRHLPKVIRKDDRACEYLIILALWWEFINKGGLASNADVFADFGLSIAEERLWKQS